MSVGEALAEARSRAGLSVGELSERTRIRTMVIERIERDDFAACGGDLFVRGYVRALAAAVGIDPQPLIREYNRTRPDGSGSAQVAHVARITDEPPPAEDPAATMADRPVPFEDPAPTLADLPVVAGTGFDAAAADWARSAAGLDVTIADLPVVPEDPAPTVSDIPVIPAEAAPPQPPPPQPPPPPPLPGNWVAEPPSQPRRPRSQRSPRSARTPQNPRSPRSPQNPRSPRSPQGTRRSRGTARIAIPGVLALAVAGVVTGFALSGRSAPPSKNAAAFAQHTSHAAQAPLGSGSHGNTSASPASNPASTPSAAPTTAPPPSQGTASPVKSLHIAQAEAFGPGGLADGDNPQGALSVIGRGSHSQWQSQWYTTAKFGNLKDGTGLLIDMGHPVTITSVRIDLAGDGGASLQLRVGDSARAPSSLRIATSAHNVGGTVRLRLPTPEHDRYLLIWFTLLPPNGQGQYQATVTHVAVNGR